MTKGTLETTLCHIACLLGVRKGGRAHSLLANSIQKDADSKKELRTGGRGCTKGEFIPSDGKILTT